MKEDVKPAVVTQESCKGNNPLERKSLGNGEICDIRLDQTGLALPGEPSVEGWVVKVLADDIRELDEAGLHDLLGSIRNRR